MSRWTEIRDRHAILEDESVLVLNKPAGISVVGERHETDLMQLAREAGEWLMPAHRIDKVTSGAVILAKNAEVHADLARQFQRRAIEKAYLVITQSSGLPTQGRIELPLSVGRKSRVRIAAPRESITFDEQQNLWTAPASAIFDHVKTYPSVTTFSKVWERDGNTLLVVRPITGRRHQIRVHLAWLGHAIAGDPLFDKNKPDPDARTCLHSWQIAFDQEWSDSSRIEVEAPPETAFWLPIVEHFAEEEIATSLRQARLQLRDLQQQPKSTVD